MSCQNFCAPCAKDYLCREPCRELCRISDLTIRIQPDFLAGETVTMFAIPKRIGIDKARDKAHDKVVKPPSCAHVNREVLAHTRHASDAVRLYASCGTAPAR